MSRWRSSFPFIVAAPRFFSGQIPLGGLTQTAGAFGRVQDALSWFIARYPDSLAQWHAIVERLTTFHRAVVAARAAFGTGLDAGRCAGRIGADARCHASSCRTAPSCWTDADLVLEPGHSVVITGRSGSGKSTLFRALAGIWPFGHGQRAAPGRALPVPAAAALHPAGHAAARGHLSASARRLQSRGHRAARWRMPGLASSFRGWMTTSTGRSSCPAASSSGSRWRARCWRSRTGCSWTRPPPASIRRPKPICTAR